MSHKMAKRMRKMLKDVNIDVENKDGKYLRHKKTGQVVCDEGRRVYQASKKKAARMMREGRLVGKATSSPGK